MRSAAATAALGLTLVANAAAAQSMPAASFEVASVRRVATPSMFSISKPGEKIFTVRSASMTLLLQLAFGVEATQIRSKADWLDNEYYDVSAEAEGERGLSMEERRGAVQRLLAERFKLAAHRETKDVEGYWLTVAKAGPKLKPGLDTPAAGSILPDALYSASLSLKTLAGMLGLWLHQPVTDKTGIAGNYAVKLKFAPQGATDSELPSLFTAVEEQMGLKLESHAVPVEFLVVDHIEKVPVEN